MMYFDKRASISPMITILLMVAVAVTSAFVAYAWGMNKVNAITSKIEHAIQIQSVDFTNDKVYVQNVGDEMVTIKYIFIDGTLVDTSETSIIEGETVSLRLDGNLSNMSELHIKIVCVDNTFIEGTYRPLY